MITVPDPKRPGKTKEVRYGCPHMLSKEALAKRKQIERYNKYKIDLNTLAKEMRFEIPQYGFALYFFVPIPPYIKSKKKRALMHGMIHWRKPDIDNFEKAFYDALKKMDQHVGQLSGHGKFYVDVPEDQGWIEVHLNQPIYDPFERYKNTTANLDPVFVKVNRLKRPLPKDSKVEYTDSPVDYYDAPKVERRDDEPKPWMDYEEAKKLHEFKNDFNSLGKKISVNDKSAMDKIKELSRKRSKKR